MVDVDDLQIGEQSSPASSGERAPVVKIPPTGIPLEEIERQAVVEALRMSNWVQKDAAELLGISPRVMNYKIKILSIEIPRSRGRHGRTGQLEFEPEPSASSVGRDCVRPVSQLPVVLVSSAFGWVLPVDLHQPRPRPDACSAASCSAARGRAVPGSRADRRPPAAGASRTCAGARAG